MTVLKTVSSHVHLHFILNNKKERKGEGQSFKTALNHLHIWKIIIMKRKKERY